MGWGAIALCLFLSVFLPGRFVMRPIAVVWRSVGSALAVALLANLLAQHAAAQQEQPPQEQKTMSVDEAVALSKKSGRPILAVLGTKT
jgi:hypothetical protein